MWFSYHNIFFGALIFRGKKAHAFNMFLRIKEQLKLRERFDPSLVFYVAMLKITPNVVLFPVKRSGVMEAAPFPIGSRKQVTFAVK
jgi:ribosomal protein S7